MSVVLHLDEPNESWRLERLGAHHTVHLFRQRTLLCAEPRMVSLGRTYDGGTLFAGAEPGERKRD